MKEKICRLFSEKELRLLKDYCSSTKNVRISNELSIMFFGEKQGGGSRVGSPWSQLSIEYGSNTPEKFKTFISKFFDDCIEMKSKIEMIEEILR